MNMNKWQFQINKKMISPYSLPKKKKYRKHYLPYSFIYNKCEFLQEKNLQTINRSNSTSNAKL